MKQIKDSSNSASPELGSLLWPSMTIPTCCATRLLVRRKTPSFWNFFLGTCPDMSWFSNLLSDSMRDKTSLRLDLWPVSHFEKASCQSLPGVLSKHRSWIDAMIDRRQMQVATVIYRLPKIRRHCCFASWVAGSQSSTLHTLPCTRALVYGCSKFKNRRGPRGPKQS